MSPTRLINVGCGSRFHADWLNLDLHSNSPLVTKCDLRKGIPCPNNSAKAIYSAAVVEHIPRQHVKGFLTECWRVLMPGGIIRISVPDFERQIHAYLQIESSMHSAPQKEELKDWMLLEMLDQFGRDSSGGEMAQFLATCSPSTAQFIKERIGVEGEQLLNELQGHSYTSAHHTEPAPVSVRFGFIGRMLLKAIIPSFRGSEDLKAWTVGRFRHFSGELHRWAYSESSMSGCLRNANFDAPKRMEHGFSEIPDWEKFELEVDSKGKILKPDLLIIEAVKPL